MKFKMIAQLNRYITNKSSIKYRIGNNMENVKDYTIAVLHELIKKSKDEYLLLKITSGKLEDIELMSLFTAFAVEKQEHIIKLEKELGKLGESFEMFKDDSENPIEYFESSVLGENQDLLIEECLRKDDLMILEYFNAMRKNIMWEVVPLIANQYFRSKNLHDQIKNIYTDRTERSIYQMEVQ